MDKFTIFTRSYGIELEKELKELNVLMVEKTNTGHAISMESPKETPQRLAGLMENHLLKQNPALASSPHLKKRIQEMVFADKRETLIKELNEFLEENREMNWEGYLHFRLNEFTEKINLILYSIIKKSLLRLLAM